jgi:hypothetical protein
MRAMRLMPRCMRRRGEELPALRAPRDGSPAVLSRQGFLPQRNICRGKLAGTIQKFCDRLEVRIE